MELSLTALTTLMPPKAYRLAEEAGMVKVWTPAVARDGSPVVTAEVADWAPLAVPFKVE